MISAKLTYFLLVLALAIFSLAYLGNVPIMLILTLLIVTAVTIIWSLVARKHIQIRLSAGEPDEDRRITYRIIIQNGSRFPITYCEAQLRCTNLFDGRTVKQRTRFTIPPRGEQEMVGTLQTDSAGVYELNCAKCFFTDWFRLFRRKIHAPEPVSIYVWPYCHAIQADLVNIPEEDLTSSKFSPDRAGSIPGDFFGVRDYRDGDRMQHIHWKLTGKTGQFVVKEFSLPLKNAISIVLEFSGAGDIGLKNAMLDAATTLSGFFLERGAEHELCFLKEGHLCRYAIEEQSQLYDSLRELLSRPPDTSAGQPALLAYQQPAVNKHLICVACDEKTLENPVLLDHPLPTALLQVSYEKNHQPAFMENLHVVSVDAADVQKSLTGLEL